MGRSYGTYPPLTAIRPQSDSAENGRQSSLKNEWRSKRPPLEHSNVLVVFFIGSAHRSQGRIQQYRKQGTDPPLSLWREGDLYRSYELDIFG